MAEQIADTEKQDIQPTAGAGEQAATQAVAGAFTQEQVNRVAGESRKEGRASAEKELLEKFGVKSVDEVLAVLKSHNEQEQQKLSDAERFQKQAEKAQSERDQIAKDYKALKLKVDFESVAKDLAVEFVNETAMQDAFLLIDQAAENLDLKAELKKIIEGRPHLVKPKQAPTTDAKAKSKNNSEVLPDSKIDEIRKRFNLRK